MRERIKGIEDLDLAEDEGAIAELARSMIKMLGEDPDREGLRRTPERFEGAMRF